MTVRIDTARRHHATRHIDFAQARREATADLHDAAVGNCQIGAAGIAGSRQHRVAQHRIKTLLRHMRQPV
ncbi:hypothetical protein D3C81_1879770 [compost metagenome]